MITVELVKMLRRPRTWVIIAMLVALPTLVAVLLAVTDLAPAPGEGPPFLSAVLSDGTLFPLAALGVVLPLFLGRPGDLAAADEAEAERLPRILDYVESQLRPDGFLVGGRLTLADLAVAGPFINLEHSGVSIGDRPALSAYVEAILARPSFAGWISRERRAVEKARAAPTSR